MRIALTKGTLLIPPTYFATQHAELLAAEHDFKFFTLAGAVVDPPNFPVWQAIPGQASQFSFRSKLIPLGMGRMTKQIQRWKPEVIHQHFATWATPAVNASRNAWVPMVTTLHGADVFSMLIPQPGLMGRMNRRSVEYAQVQSRLVLAVSQYLAGKAVEAGFAANRLEVHYQGVDTNYFCPATALDGQLGGQLGSPRGVPPELPPNLPLSLPPESSAPQKIIFIGKLDKSKGIADILAAFSQVSGAELHIIGAGPAASQVTAAATANPQIHYHGVLSKDQIKARLQTSTVLILGAQEQGGRREAAGLVLLEAQACGVPVVTYDSGGTAEMLRADVTGLLAPEGNIAALADGLKQVLALCPSEYTKMSRAARQWVLDNRSLTGAATQLSAFYQTAVTDY